MGLFARLVFAAGAIAAVSPSFARDSFGGGTFQYSDTVSIHYMQLGFGHRPVVLLHGLASSSVTWLDLIARLRCDCTFYALDLKGHGGSSAPNDHAYGLADNSAIVRAFIAEKQLRDVILIGHSYGGSVALRTALDYPPGSSPIERLVLLGTPGTKQHFPLYLTALRRQKMGRFFETFTPAELSAWIALRHVYYDKRSVTPLRIVQYASLWRDPESTRAMRETASQFLHDGLRTLSGEVEQVSLPVLVIAGANDRIVRAKHQRKLAARIPGAQFATLRHCGHVPQEELPEETAAKINAFLQNDNKSTELAVIAW